MCLIWVRASENEHNWNNNNNKKKFYRKNSKIWDSSNNCHNCPKIEKFDVTCINASKRCWWNGKQRRPWSDCFFRSSLILVCTVCWDLSVPIHRICTVLQKFLLRENGLTWRCLRPLFLTLGLGWGRDHNGHHTHEPSTVNQCTVITLNIGTPRPATVVVLNIKQFNFTLK